VFTLADFRDRVGDLFAYASGLRARFGDLFVYVSELKARFRAPMFTTSVWMFTASV